MKAVNIADLRNLARRRLPKVVFDYVDGGAEDEVTLRENVAALASVGFRPRQCISVSQCELGTTVLGENLSMPALLAPIGYTRVLHPDGERGAARAAGLAGTGYILSTISGHKLEDVKAATAVPAWFQLYLVGGREAAEAVMERASKAGFSRLVVTVDTPIAGMRERDHRNGMAQLLGGSILASIPFLPQVLTHPRWLAAFLLDGGVPDLPNIVIPGEGPMPLMDVGAALSKTAVTWADFKWIRAAWKGPVVVKGILTGDDARCAVDEGAAAVVVSNHGGRQLDYAAASFRVLPEVVEAVGNQVEVLMDGGIRRGSDIIKALCLGARAVLLGRAYAYGLAAAGEAGASRAIEIIRADMERTLKLVGCSSVADLDASYLDLRVR
jgi:isopentenyl diphosphate isomerase/L-lactate dehydrogenase-like FMN-dependent dehydrogenase